MTSFIDDVAAGRAPEDLDPETAATALVAICDGLQLQYLLRPEMDILIAFDELTRPYRVQHPPATYAKQPTLAD